MAGEKDPKQDEADEAAPKKRGRRKPKAAAAAPAAETTSKTETAADDEPAAEPEPAARKPAARKAAAPKPADEPKAEAAPESAAAADAAAEAEAAEEKPKPRRTRRKAADATPAEPVAAPKRAARATADGPPVVRAHAKYVRTSARKARLVCDHIRGKSVPEARAILAHASRDVARDWSKLLESAVANAEHNHELIGDELRIQAVKADEGPTLKRFRPRAMGRATKIRKRTSHLSITLTPKDGDY
jgi:large subunit ribosomal protein L22